MEPLDNPAWHALTGPQAHFAQGSGLALRYEPEVSVFGAVPREPATEAWDALRELIGAQGAALLFQAGQLDAPAGWQTLMRLPGHQMVATEPIGRPDDAFIALAAPDVPDMLDLVSRTKPGPFLSRTIELGTYLGLRDEDGALIAMAGERVHLDGYTEISAVCTDERARKQGLATRLVRAIALGIEARGETPMLHTAIENENAIRIYEALGFRIRTTFDFCLFKPTG
jgi:ribosomal protein S18 acetylase RimI-like enzyme